MRASQHHLRIHFILATIPCGRHLHYSPFRQEVSGSRRSQEGPEPLSRGWVSDWAVYLITLKCERHLVWGEDARTIGSHLSSMGFLKCGEVSSIRELWKEEFELPEYNFKIRGPLILGHKAQEGRAFVQEPGKWRALPNGTSTFPRGRRFGGRRVHWLAPKVGCLPLSDSTCAGLVIPLGAENPTRATASGFPCHLRPLAR